MFKKLNTLKLPIGYIKCNIFIVIKHSIVLISLSGFGHRLVLIRWLMLRFSFCFP